MKNTLFLAAVLTCLVAPAGLAAEPPELAEAIGNAPAGQWTQLQKDDVGGRVHSKIVYAPSVEAFVYWGTRSHSKKLSSYDTELFELKSGQWTEAFPPGKDDWKGDYKQWPGWNMGGSTAFYDWKGVQRPRPTIVYNMAAWDAGKNRVVYYCDITFAYDPAARAWTELKPEDGPPPGLYGSAMCYDSGNKRMVLFGGFGAEAPEGRPGTWYFDCQKDEWSRPEFGPEELNKARAEVGELGKRARRLRRDAQYLMGLTGQERKEAEEGLAAAVGKLHGALQGAMAKFSIRDKEWPEEDEAKLAAATKLVEKAAAAVGKAQGLKDTALVAALEEAEDGLLYRAVDALRVQPPPRCNTPLVYDPKSKLVVVFGGDHLNYKLGDTWVLDTEKNRWTRREPKPSPPPQYGHAACYLPKSGLVLMASPLGNWTYDAAGNAWKPVSGQGPAVSRNAGFYVAAVPGTDTAIGVEASRYNTRSIWVYKLDPAAPPAKHQAAAEIPTAPLSKTVNLSRKWYDDLPAPDPEAFAARLKAVPENVWTPLKSEKEIRARTWSSSTFDSKRREIIYWGGGHSGNVNSNVDHYSLRTGRWSRNLDSSFKPWPFGAMAACPNGRTYYDEPWTMHARKTYAYDPVSGSVIMTHVGGGGRYRLRDGREGRYTWVYNPAWGEWTDRIDTPFQVRYDGAAVTTPRGVMVFYGGQVWLLDAAGRTWNKVGEPKRLPEGEYYTLVYDSKRDRMVYLAGDKKTKAPQTWLFDLAAKTWQQAQFEGEGCYSRDAVYVPGQDAILAHAGGGKFKVLLCAEDKWIQAPPVAGTRQGVSEHSLTVDPVTELALFFDVRSFCGPFEVTAFRLNAEKLNK